MFTWTYSILIELLVGLLTDYQAACKCSYCFPASVKTKKSPSERCKPWKSQTVMLGNRPIQLALASTEWQSFLQGPDILYHCSFDHTFPFQTGLDFLVRTEEAIDFNNSSCNLPSNDEFKVTLMVHGNSCPLLNLSPLCPKKS